MESWACKVLTLSARLNAVHVAIVFSFMVGYNLFKFVCKSEDFVFAVSSPIVGVFEKLNSHK
jgi:hypothetical protein